MLVSSTIDVSQVPESVLLHHYFTIFLFSFESSGIWFEDVTNVSVVCTVHHRLSKEVIVRYIGIIKNCTRHTRNVRITWIYNWDFCVIMACILNETLIRLLPRVLCHVIC